MIDVLTKLDELARRIKNNNDKYKSLGNHNKPEIKRRVSEKYYQHILEFKAICVSVVDDDGNTIYELIKNKVINTYSQDKTFFAMAKPPEIDDLKNVKIFEVEAMSHGGLWVSLDGQRSLLPLFGDIGSTNLEKLGSLFEQEETTRE